MMMTAHSVEIGVRDETLWKQTKWKQWKHWRVTSSSRNTMVTSDFRLEVEYGRLAHAQCIRSLEQFVHYGRGHGADTTFHRTYFWCWKTNSLDFVLWTLNFDDMFAYSLVSIQNPSPVPHGPIMSNSARFTWDSPAANDMINIWDELSPDGVDVELDVLVYLTAAAICLLDYAGV